MTFIHKSTHSLRRLIIVLSIIGSGLILPIQSSAESFFDVPPNHWAFNFIDRLAASGITAGCGNGNYCPDSPVTRAQMAVFLVRGIHGSGFSPPAASGNAFLDVSALSFAASFIEQFSLDGITAGCGNNNYCPDAKVTRNQMAVFLLRAKHGAGYSPPAATGLFKDVPLSHWAVHWIEQLSREGITSGCGNGNYCPGAIVTRAQMAVFLVRAFGLPAPVVDNGPFLSISSLFFDLNDAGVLAFFGRTESGSGIFKSSPVGTGMETSTVVFGSFSVNGMVFEPAGLPTINGLGAIAFLARTSDGNTGIFLSDGMMTPIVIEGDEAPGTGGMKFENLWFPVLNDLGDVAFWGAGGGFSGIFLATSGGIEPVVLSGDLAPAPSGAVFTSFGEESSLNNVRQVAFVGNTDVGLQGIFRASETAGQSAMEIEKIVLEGEQVPDRTNSFAIRAFTFQDVNLDINDSGTIGFSAEIDQVFFGSGAFLASNLGLETIAIVGDFFDSRSFFSFRGISLNDLGVLAFNAKLGNRCCIAGAHSIYASSGGPITPLVRSDVPTSVGILENLAQDVVINNAGTIAFPVATNGGQLIGLFVADGGNIRTAVRIGDPSPTQ